MSQTIVGQAELKFARPCQYQAIFSVFKALTTRNHILNERTDIIFSPKSLSLCDRKCCCCCFFRICVSRHLMTLLFCDIRLLPHCSRPIKKLLVGPDLFSGPSSSERKWQNKNTLKLRCCHLGVNSQTKNKF